MSIEGTTERIIEVCKGWGLYDDINASDKTRFEKLEEEVEELEEALFMKKDRASILEEGGDVAVTLINVLHKKGITLQEALFAAYMKIKDREGQMVKGKFVKKEDLENSLKGELNCKGFYGL